MFDWMQFLDRYGVEYVTSGHNARRGNIGVRCPFCADDPSHHMGISTTGRGWCCWRNPSAHSGKSPVRLVAALVGCTYEEARVLVSSDSVSFAKSDDSFSDDVMRRLGVVMSAPRYHNSELRPLDEFVPVEYRGMCRLLVYPYLKNRGYDRDDADWLADRYQLMFAPRGKFAYRIIVPIVVGRRLVNWTGRTVARGEDLRYKSLSSDPEKAAAQYLPVAPMNIKDTLFDFDGASRGGEILVLTEGPFDAMRVGFLGEDYGVRGTCLYSKSVTPAQIDLLAKIVDRYDRVVSLLDRGAEHDLFGELPDYLGVTPLRLPGGFKDPAELTRESFVRLLGV